MARLSPEELREDAPDGAAAGTAPHARAAGWERYRLIADNSGDVVYQTGTDGRIQWVQPTVEQLLGYPPDELIGVSARDLVHPDDLPMVNELRVGVYGGAELDEIRCRFVRSDGTSLLCHVRARPVRDDSGEVVGAVLALRDVHEQTAALRAVATLIAANTELVRAEDEAALLKAMCDAIVSGGGYSYVWYGRALHDEGRLIRLESEAGPEVGVMDGLAPSWGDGPMSQGLSATAIRERRTEVRNGIVTDPRTAGLQQLAGQHGLDAGIAIPVLVHGVIDGALAVYSGEPGTFDDLAQQLLENLAGDLGYGLERLREREQLRQATARDEEQRRMLRGILDAQLDPLVLLAPVRDDDGTIEDLEYVEANEAALRYNGLTYRQQIGRRFLEMHPALGPSGLARRYMDVIETGEPVILDEYSYGNPNLGGDVRRYDIRAVRSGDAVVLTWHDATSRFEARQRLEESELRYRQLVENVSDVVIENDADGVITWITDSCYRVLGWSAEEMVGSRTRDLLHPEELDRIERITGLLRMGMTAQDEMRYRTASGSFRWMQVTAQVSNRRGGPFGIVSLRDIHDQVSSRAALEFAVRHDPLTGLVTRAMLVRRMEQDSLAGAGVHAVLTVGVDGLARVNEALTHVAGDAVIAGVAARVWEVVADQDRVARGSGDEIVLALPGLESGALAGEIADRIRDSVRRPLDVSGHRLVPTVSVGIATTEPGEPFDADELLRASSLAMRAAKSAGGDRTAFVDPELSAAAGRRLQLEADLNEAIATGALQPWFQPVVDMASGEVVGYEALVRWVLPDGAVRPPDEFLPVAERGHLVVDIDRAVVTQAVAHLRRIPSHRHIAVNVSARSIVRSDYVDHVLELVRTFDVPPERLVLEITETALFQDVELVRGSMQRLADAGLRWYVDDFGTGYSSIAHLRDLPVAGLKLDRSFTQGIGAGDATCIRLAHALAGLASGLELDTVAEGVETEAEAAHLVSQGWKHGQGWLFGRPGPAPDHS